jgi:hypothetical protein
VRRAADEARPGTNFTRRAVDPDELALGHRVGVADPAFGAGAGGHGEEAGQERVLGSQRRVVAVVVDSAIARTVLALGSWGLVLGGVMTELDPVTTMGMLGSFVAPNMGHWYQGKFVTLGTGIRFIAGLGMIAGMGVVASCEDHCESDEASRNDRVGIALFIGSGIVYIGGTIYDIVDAPLRAYKHNRRIEALGIAPLMTNGATGLALGGRF